MPSILLLSDNLTTNTGLCISDRQLLSSFPLHWHEYFEIEYILSGSGKIILNGAEFDYHKNSLLFMSPSDLQEIQINQTTEIINISFTNEWISDELSGFLSSGCIISDYENHLPHLLYEEYGRNDKYSSIYAKHLLNGILIDIIRYLNESNNISLNPSILKIIHFMRIHFKEPITLNDIAGSINFAPTYCSQIFSNTLGISIKKYLIHLRLTYARKLLLSTDMTISEICYCSGFNDFSNFMKLFKKSYNITPKQYRYNCAAKKTENNFAKINRTIHLAKESITDIASEFQDTLL